MKSLSGLLLINKASGPSSKDVSRDLEKKFGRSLKMGHCGTLDPLASGLLLVVLGSGTKVQSYLTGFDKSYTFTFKLGYNSDTLDADGSVECIDKDFKVTKAQVDSLIDSFVGEIRQTPPLISAKKYKGKPLYKYARSGKASEINLEQFSQNIKISRLELLDVEANQVSMSVDCSKGTYVRSLARDIAKLLGTTAIITKLHRTKVQRFDLENSLPSQSIVEMSADEIQSKIIPLHQIDTDAFLPVVVNSSEDVQQLRYGNIISAPTQQFSKRFAAVKGKNNQVNLEFRDAEQTYILFESDYSPIGLGNIKNNGINSELKIFRGLNK